jgi:glutamate synthase (NADPH/NADH) small chain
MHARDAGERSHSFREVNLGLEAQIAILEAQRCLDLQGPQVRRAAVRSASTFRSSSASWPSVISPARTEVLLRDNACPDFGRVCPQEKQCECKCIRCGKKGEPVAIGYLERFVADWARLNGRSSNTPPRQ